MKRRFFVVMVVLSAALLVWACGGKTGEADKAETAVGSAEIQEAQPAASQPAGEGTDMFKAEGEAVAKEILDTFDRAVAEAAELANAKPDAAALKPQVEAIIEKYGAAMADLNGRFLALKAKDIRSFGAANGYMGENRGLHVHAMYTTLNPALAYYNFEKGDQETVDLITKRLAELIDIAVKM